MPLLDHLRELRTRLTVSAIAIAAGFLVCYGWAEEIFGVLVAPLAEALPEQHGALVYTGLIEPFMVYLKTALIGGLLLAMPVVFWQMWLFVRPAFRGNEERFATTFVLAGSLLFVTGAVFGYVVVFPAGFKFFIQLGGGKFLPYIRMEEYFSLATRMLMAFGLAFETPLLFYMLGRMGLVSGATLKKNRGVALIASFVIGAILTPGPDPISQTLMSLPLFVLYEASIWLVVLFGKKSAADSA